MKKKLIIWGVTGIAMIVTIAVILLLPGQDGMQLDKAKIAKLTAGQAITIDTEAEDFGVQLGDAFSYFVDVIYNPEMVDEVDIDSLIQVVNLDPFEIREIRQSEIKLDANTRMYRIAYTLQFIDDDTDEVYEFPSIVVRYIPAGEDGYMEFPATPEPIYVLSRMPDNLSDIFVISGSDFDLGYGMLRPLSGDVISIDTNRTPWIVMAIGIFFIIGAVADYTLRILPQKRQEKDNLKSEKNKFVADAYALIHKNIDNGSPAEYILYRMDHLIRLVLSQKENLDPLEDFNYDLIPPEIRNEVISLFENTQRAVDKCTEQQLVEESMAYIDKILRHYFKEEVDSWTN
jgi:hypothetical protein